MTERRAAGPASSWATSPAARAVMLGNRSRDTKPELRVRRAAHALGLRYRVGTRPLADFACRADMVFSAAKVAVFIDGCFWHGCPQHHRPPQTNAGYWASKVERNVARDRRADAAMAAAGWLVVRAGSMRTPPPWRGCWQMWFVPDAAPTVSDRRSP